MPSTDPPEPGLPDDWNVSSLTWVNLGSGLGRFYSGTTAYYLSAVGNNTVGVAAWKIDTTAPANGNVEAQFTSAVAGVLKNGVIQRGQGTISDSGVTYKLVEYWNGTQMTAVLS